MANDGGDDAFRMDKNNDPLLRGQQFATGDDRQEDMECDTVTFGVEVMWVGTTPQSKPAINLITAYEIEPGTCAVGGGGEPGPVLEIALDPPSADNEVDTDHTVTATVNSDGNPLVNVLVSFEVTAGPRSMRPAISVSVPRTPTTIPTPMEWSPGEGQN